MAVVYFFFNDTATTEIYTLSLHDALPISRAPRRRARREHRTPVPRHCGARTDRKSTRLNSSHSQISYAVFCLKKKKKNSSVFTSDEDSYSGHSYSTTHSTIATIHIHVHDL